MIVLRLLAIFIFSALLTGCPVTEKIEKEVEALKADIAQFKKIVWAIAHHTQPCKPPGQHSEIECHYKLKISKVLEQGKAASKYQGNVPDSVVLEANDRCRKGYPDPNQCVSYGDTATYNFTIDGPLYAVGDVVECINDTTTNHLKDCKVDQSMKKT